MHVVYPNALDLIGCNTKFVDTVSELPCFRRGEAGVSRKSYVVHIDD
jgi:hypothetical protein